MRRHRQAWDLRLRLMRRNRKADRHASQGPHGLDPDSRASTPRSGRGRRGETDPCRPDAPPPAHGTSARRRLAAMIRAGPLIPPQCPACGNGYLVHRGVGARCMVAHGGGPAGLELEDGCGYQRPTERGYRPWWSRFCAARAETAARAIQRHIANDDRRRDPRRVARRVARVDREELPRMLPRGRTDAVRLGGHLIPTRTRARSARAPVRSGFSGRASPGRVLQAESASALPALPLGFVNASINRLTRSAVAGSRFRSSSS